jgi:hypothetical protein
MLLFEAVLFPRASALLGASGPMDLKLFYTPAEAYVMIQSYGEAGRSAYRTSELTLDIFFPIAYTLFLALSISWLHQRAFDESSVFRRVNLLPLGVWLFDLTENLGIVALLSLFPAHLTSLFTLTAIATGLKWAFAGFTIFFLVFGLFAYVLARFRK